ncbi:hypothetical protein B0T11DRAFT_325605 [Plectosphaerella cucumerina]|uniref:Survival Motor Neuron Gemin2-binding domain-containing protein n=1 Tax=Plectosphaerella cucumerina TaxID=40658 RepID=A0A8K0THS3_9PEZI|nr:hypothetical protein B0T11DRAFT_325605 [Plectosphaerella cucumerina]
MAPNNNELTHDEVWDDSALIDSWNEALDEYKKYHSIHAKGGRPEDLTEEELNLLQSQPAVKTETPDGDQTTAAPPAGPADQAGAGAAQSAVHADTSARASRSDHGGASSGLGVPPQALLGSVQDEGLKKLLMSWYYAGYYTGLYEGQQQARVQREGDGPGQQA